MLYSVWLGESNQKTLVDNQANDIQNQTVTNVGTIVRKYKLAVESTYEARANNIVMDDITNNTGEYFNNLVESLPTDDASSIEEKAGLILATITNLGIVLSIVMSAVLGVKYMLASVEERADYKKDMIPYLVGATLLFGISLVVKIVQSLGNQINSSI